MFISAASNFALGLLWAVAVLAMPLCGVLVLPLWALATAELIVGLTCSANSPDELRSKATVIAACEIAGGISLNIIALVCGIIVLVNVSKLRAA
jgi:hypothetical protein